MAFRAREGMVYGRSQGAKNLVKERVEFECWVQGLLDDVTQWVALLYLKKEVFVFCNYYYLNFCPFRDLDLKEMFLSFLLFLYFILIIIYIVFEYKSYHMASPAGVESVSICHLCLSVEDDLGTWAESAKRL